MIGQSFDIIIVGAGVAGLLTAHRVCSRNPTLKVVLIEKESRIGGRAVTGGQAHQYGYGLQGVSPRLYEFWNQALKLDPEADDLPSLMDQRYSRTAILMGSKLTELKTSELCSERGARALGGLAASRQWADVTSILEAEDRFENTFADRWKAPRKSPATLVLETYAQSFGITNIWDSTPGGIAERAAAVTAQMYGGNWAQAMSALVDKFIESTHLTIVLDARVYDASFDAATAESPCGWSIETAKGEFKSNRLIVAQPPWTASQWLPKNLWPSALATVINKTKPVSAVTLSCPIESGDTSSLPDIILIAAENTQAIVSKTEIVFQATIDYEMSLVAPDVVKAVKRLKRSHRKLLASVPEIKTGIEHLSLVPVSWAQSPHNNERKHLDKLKMTAIQKSHLAFCGDAYGQSLDGDANLIDSVISSSEAALT